MNMRHPENFYSRITVLSTLSIYKQNSDCSKMPNYSDLLDKVEASPNQSPVYTYTAIKKCYVFYSVRSLDKMNSLITINDTVKVYGGYVYYPASAKKEEQCGNTFMSGNIVLNKDDKIQISNILYAFIYVIGCK